MTTPSSEAVTVLARALHAYECGCDDWTTSTCFENNVSSTEDATGILEALSPADLLVLAGVTEERLGAALHEQGIGCKPNIPGCRASHKGHAGRIFRELVALTDGPAGGEG